MIRKGAIRLIELHGFIAPVRQHALFAQGHGPGLQNQAAAGAIVAGAEVEIARVDADALAVELAQGLGDARAHPAERVAIDMQTQLVHRLETRFAVQKGDDLIAERWRHEKSPVGHDEPAILTSAPAAWRPSGAERCSVAKHSGILAPFCCEDESMRIVADDNMPGVEACCALLDDEAGSRIEIVRRPGRTLTAADVADADVLLVRSITRVDAALLAGSRVRFVGTATIGTDHLDLPWLDAQGIAWASAPGCNARAVGEWVLNVLVQLAAEQGVTLAGRTLGIIGLGHVGRWVARLTRLLGIRVVACDPFLSASDLPEDMADMELLSLTALLAVADMVSIHTPLTRSGAYPTHHLLDAAELAQLRPECLADQRRTRPGDCQCRAAAGTHPASRHPIYNRA